VIEKLKHNISLLYEKLNKKKFQMSGTESWRFTSDKFDQIIIPEDKPSIDRIVHVWGIFAMVNNQLSLNIKLVDEWRFALNQ